MLAVDHLQAAYGPAQVLFDICLRVGAGEVVTLLGRNGMGKTTTIRTLMGLLPACGGSAALAGVSLLWLPPHRSAPGGPRACSPGPADFSHPHRRGESDRDRGFAPCRAAMDARARLRFFSPARGAAPPHGQ